MDGRKKESKEKNVGISSSSRVLRSSARARTEEVAVNFLEQHQQRVVSGNENSTSAELAIITESAVTKALTNAVILANLVKYLPAKKLPTLRLTCKLWNEAIIKELRQKHSQLKFSIYHGGCWCCRSKADTAKHAVEAMKQFVATMKSSSKIPFGMYYILDVGLAQKCVRELFTVCGNSIESLTLHLENTNKVSLSQVGQLLFIQLPALRQLEIKSFYDDSWKEDPRYVPQVNGSGRLPRLKSIEMPIPTPTSNLMKPFQNLLIDILRAAVNLERIDLTHDKVDSDRDYSNEDSDDVEEAKSVQHDVHYNKPIILLLKREANFETLKYLDLSDITTAELKMLISLSELEGNTNQLSIREFSTFSLKANVFAQHNGAHISRFLELQADTLKKLRIGAFDDYMLPKNTTVLIALPRMKSLMKLEIYTIDESFDHIKLGIQFDSFCISFPKLEHLTFNHYSLNDDQWNQCLNPAEAEAGNPDYRHRLQSLVAPLIENAGQLKRLAALFPGIWKLEVTLDSLDLFPELWTTWPGLRSLKVKFSNFNSENEYVALDGYITGINMQDFYVPQKETRSSGTKPQVRAVRKSVLNSGGKSKRLDLNDVKTRPGITDLKELTEFSLNVSDSSNSEYITNISCYYGFGVSGSKLRVINITDRNGITKRCRADMQKVLGSDADLNFNWRPSRSD